MQIYTHLAKLPFGNAEAEILNIVCIHLNDMGEDTTIEAVYLKKHETKEDHMKFENDAHGRPLRYKILVDKLAIKQVLFNTGSSIENVPHEEVRIEVG